MSNAYVNVRIHAYMVYASIYVWMYTFNYVLSQIYWVCMSIYVCMHKWTHNMYACLSSAPMSLYTLMSWRYMAGTLQIKATDPTFLHQYAKTQPSPIPTSHVIAMYWARNKYTFNMLHIQVCVHIWHSYVSSNGMYIFHITGPEWIFLPYCAYSYAPLYHFYCILHIDPMCKWKKN